MSGSLGTQHLALLLSIFACTFSVAAIMVRKAAGWGRRPRSRYCPRCGWLQPQPDHEVVVAERIVTTHAEPRDSASVSSMGRRRLDAIETPLPSDFLRAEWCRKGLAMNKHGDRLVNTALDDPEAPVAWTLAGAVLAAFQEPRAGYAYERVLADVLLRWHGTADVDGWSAAPEREPEHVIAVALEAERRLFGCV